jgi:hypothetical protein
LTKSRDKFFPDIDIGADKFTYWTILGAFPDAKVYANYNDYKDKMFAEAAQKKTEI